MNQLKHYDLHDVNPFKIDIIEKQGMDVMYEITNKIWVKLIGEQEEAIHQAIVKEAIKDGVSDLYILDKRFVFDALREKMEREGVSK